MTLWQDPPPQTRRQARESERAAALQAENAGRSRRAGTAAPTVAGDIPAVNTPFGANGRGDSTRESGRQSDALGQAPAARPVPPRYDGVKFDTLVKPSRAPSELFQPASTNDRPEPVTQPVDLVTPPPSVPQTVSVAQETVQPPEPVADEEPERTLTRRELRAMLQAQQGNEQGADEPSAPVSASADEFDPTPAPVSAQSFADILAPPASATEPAESSPIDEPRPYQPPTGHWSIAAQQTDDAPDADLVDIADRGSDGTGQQQSPGYARSRVTSGSVTSSNALILPTVPSIADATGPLTSTGEILVTGSIDLPRSLGATGTHSDRFDSSDIDRLFEQSEGEQNNTADVAPIRASRAVSTHTSTRDTITPRKHPGNKLPTVLAITAAVLALGVVGLLVAGYVFKVF